MSKTKFHAQAHLAQILVACSLFTGAGLTYAQSEKPQKVSKAEATIGEMTQLAKQLKVEKLRKDLRDTTGAEEKEKAAAASQAALPQVLASPVVAAPQAPAVASVAGVGQKLVATLSNGMQVSAGAHVGEWRVIAVDATGVRFERCEKQAKRKGKSKEVTSECTTQFVAPGTFG